ncbi:MAG: PIN domain-containing protein [Candidatus Korarchaeota archaeon]|nr:PIN domain-containing protein [Candidatus Korarchaeota archaeon]
MSALIDSSVSLHLLLDGDRDDEAEVLLGSVEKGALRAYTTTHVLEEVSFKLLLGKGGARFAKDKEFRKSCLEALETFRDYISSLRGLTIEEVTLGDWERSVEICRHGLLTSDALLAAVA